MSMEAPRVWRQHHNGGLTFKAEVRENWLVLPWTGKRVEMVADQEEMRGRLREVGFNEEGVESLMVWLFGIPAKAAVPALEVVESFV